MVSEMGPAMGTQSIVLHVVAVAATSCVGSIRSMWFDMVVVTELKLFGNTQSMVLQS